MTDRPKYLRVHPPPGARVTARQRPESGIQASIIKALGLCPDFKIFRNNCGVAKHDDGSRVVYGLLPGSGDLIGILRMPEGQGTVGIGRFVSLEVKAPGNYPTPSQRAWANMVRSMGGFAATVRSAVEARAALDRARAGASE